MAGIAMPGGIEQDVAVGLVGPHALLERIVLRAGLPAPADPNAGVVAIRSADTDHHGRLLLAPYRSEQEAPERAARLASAADALLFAGPAPLAYATRADALSCPATCIELAGEPLTATLSRARRTGTDPGRASFDTFSQAEVSLALDDAGITASGPQVRDELGSPAALASYHARLWQIGLTSAAVTSLEEVARRLAAGKIPAFIVRPSEQAISAGLRTTTLLAQVLALAGSQLAVALAEVPALRDAAGADAPRQVSEQMRLRVHAFLVREALRIGATVSPVSDHGFLVVATSGTLRSAADGGPPFAARAQRQLGVTLDVGIGTGRTAREAEDAARDEIRRHRHPPATDRAPPVVAVTASQTPGGRPRVASLSARLAASPAGSISGAADSATRTGAAASRARSSTGTGTAGARQRADSLSRLRSLETLARLAHKLAADASPVVDAELTGKLLSVTPRTARRQLRALADQGLALPLPPRRAPHPGRPRQAYRLVVEKLDRSAAQ